MAENTNKADADHSAKNPAFRGPGGPGGRGPMGRGGPGAKPQHAGKTLKRIFSYMKEYKLLLGIVAVCIVFSSSAMVVLIYMMKPVINNFIIPLIGSQNPDLSEFVKMLIILGAAASFGAIASFINSRIMLHISTKTLFKIRTQLFDAMDALPIKYFDSKTHGELMSHYTNDTDTLRDMLSQTVPQLLSSVLSIASTFVMMLILSPVLTILVVVMVFVMVFAVAKIGSASGKAFRSQQAQLGKVNGFIEEMIEGQKVVKVFCREKQAKLDFEKLNDELCKAGTRAHTFANILMPLMGNLSYINYALTAIAGALMVITGRLDLGSIASFLQYSRNFAHPIAQMSQQFNGVLNALAGSERIFKVIDEQSETDEGYVTLVNARITENDDGTKTITECTECTGHWAWKHPHSDGTLSYTELKGAVEFSNVTFGYKENKTVLHDITIKAHPGQKIALVGSTGSGKTTITNLINRFYDAPDGKIRYDGININKIKKADLRRSLGMVLQDTHLFTGTIADNIRYGKLDASDDEVIAAAKRANADFFIRRLKDGYNTVITGDGGNLSQGQRQLLSIARAAIANPPALILDEATSSIDTRTEAHIEQGMDDLMRGRTVFVIAHRLSTVRNADIILVLEEGKIIERGSHDELLALKGRYYKLYSGLMEAV